MWGKPKRHTPVLPPASPPPAPIKPGDQIGNYSIARLLGAGGMGAVYEAQHIHTDRRAVIKVLRPEMSRDVEVARRFVNEARAAGDLNHRNIVTIYECGQATDGQWYIAMEYLAGQSLDALVEFRGGILSPDEVVSIIGQAAAGLQAAHEHGIVHRDVKAANLVVGPDDHVKVIDFGVAKLARGPGAGGTVAGSIFGTPDHMAPEQLRGEEVDRRVDVFALGTVAWEVLTGQRMWSVTGEETAAGILERQLQGTRPLDPRALRPEIPPTMGAAVARAVAFRREDRFLTIAEFALALAHGLPSEWGGTGIEILRRVAPDLLLLGPLAATVGNPELPRHVAAPTLRSFVEPGGLPFVLTTEPPRPAERGGAATRAASAANTPTASPATGLLTAVVTDAAPAFGRGEVATAEQTPVTGTLRDAVGQVMAASTVTRLPRARTTSRRSLALGAVGALALGGVVTMAVGMSGRLGHRKAHSTPAPVPSTIPAPPPTAPTSTLSVVSEPPGAVIWIDGASRGTEPITVTSAVGQQLAVRAELAGHVTATKQVQVAEAPLTVRLTLSPTPVAAPPHPAGRPGSAAVPPKGKRPRDRSAPAAPAAFDPERVVNP